MSLIKAALLGNLEEVKALIEANQNALDLINAEDNFYQMRAIDAAAFKNNLKIVDYLLSQGALITAPTNRQSLFFFLISNTQADNDSLHSVINWLHLHQNDLLKSDDTLTIDHFNAVFGLRFNQLSEALHVGLLPVHYGFLARNPNCNDVLPRVFNQTLSSNGFFNSCSVIFLLAKTCSWRLLEELVDEYNVCINLNETTDDEQHFLYGMTIGWILAQEGQWTLFNKILLKNKSTVNFNAMPQNNSNPFYGTTLVFLLAAQKQWELFSHLVGKKSNISMIDFNNGPKNHNSLSYGITITWLLVADNQWLLLNNLLNTYSFACDIDLNAGPLNEHAIYQGISIACLLASKKQWQLLANLINRHSQPFFIDLNAMPKNRERKSFGATLAWLLVLAQQWELLNLISHKSDKPITTYLNAGPKEKPTVAWLLASAKQWSLLREFVKTSQDIIELDNEYGRDKQTITTLLLANEQVELFEEIMVRNWDTAEHYGSSGPNMMKRKREQVLSFFKPPEKTLVYDRPSLQTNPLFTK